VVVVSGECVCKGVNEIVRSEVGAYACEAADGMMSTNDSLADRKESDTIGFCTEPGIGCSSGSDVECTVYAAKWSGSIIIVN
jgi:hypothetical protein